MEAKQWQYSVVKTSKILIEIIIIMKIKSGKICRNAAM